MLYNNNILKNIDKSPVNGKCYFSNVPFNDCVSIKEYQQKVMEVLRVFDEICKKHNIKYFLMYGTLMGAVRHKGFIPWDDDVDVIMPREEYEKLRKVCKEELSEEYALVDAYVTRDYTFTYGRLRKKDTTYIINCEIANNYCSGIYIDIIYYDYLSENKLLAAIQKRTYRNYHRIVSFGYSQHIYHVSYFEEYFFGALSKVVGRNNLLRFFEKIMSFPKKDKCSKIMINMLIPSVNLIDELDKEHFEKQQWITFEGETLPIPQKSHELLDTLYFQEKIKKNCNIPKHVKTEDTKSIQDNIHYADYQFIPLDKSNPRHRRVAFDLERPSEYYTEYYEQFFDRKANNRNAIKDRRYRERAAKYGVRMNEVSTKVFIAIQELNTKRFFVENQTRIEEEIEKENYTWFTEKVYVLDLVWQANIEFEILNYVYKVMLLAGEHEYSLRIKSKRDALYPEHSNDELDQLLDLQINAWYAMCSQEYSKAKELLEKVDEKWKNALIFKELEMMILQKDGKYEESLSISDEIISKNKNLFMPLYCKGVSLHMLGRTEEAKKYMNEALNCTLFMPFIQKALDYIKLMEDE